MISENFRLILITGVGINGGAGGDANGGAGSGAGASVGAGLGGGAGIGGQGQAGGEAGVGANGNGNESSPVNGGAGAGVGFGGGYGELKELTNNHRALLLTLLQESVLFQFLSCQSPYPQAETAVQEQVFRPQSELCQMAVRNALFKAAQQE